MIVAVLNSSFNAILRVWGGFSREQKIFQVVAPLNPGIRSVEKSVHENNRPYVDRKILEFLPSLFCTFFENADLRWIGCICTVHARWSLFNCRKSILWPEGFFFLLWWCYIKGLSQLDSVYWRDILKHRNFAIRW